MITKLRRYVYLPLFILMASCSRKGAESSSVQISLPGAPAQFQKSSASGLSTVSFCYFVNITGSGLKQTDSTCAPSQGTSSGFVNPSATIQLTVAKGTGRTIELYGYIPQSGETCAALAAQLSGVPVNRLFRLDSRAGIDMSADTVNVDLTSNFPGLNQHYGIQGALPVTCYASLPAVTLPGAPASGNPLHLDAGTQESTGNGYKLVGRIGRTFSNTQLQAVDGTKLLVK